MIKIQDKKNCSGCHACANICPKKCIAMQADEEGFLYPQIDNQKCVNCGLCEKICPILHKAKIEQKTPKAFAAYNKNEKIRLESSSGGIFSILAEFVISQNGVVFGAGFNKDFEVEHIAVDNVKDLSKLRVSKYVQSRIGESYQKAKDFLDNGRLVLFTGTPCQIGGLVSFLGKSYDNLLTQDIICHGVPSPAIWKSYIEYRQNLANSKVKEIVFRKKIKSWKRYSFSFSFENETNYVCTPSWHDPMMKMFLHNKCLRPSCHECAFKTKSRLSDITLADFWGIGRVAPDMDDDKGTSLVIIHSQKGQDIFEKLKDKMEFKEVDFEKAIRNNKSMISSVKPYKRAKLMKDFQSISFDKVIKKHGKGIF